MKIHEISHDIFVAFHSPRLTVKSAADVPLVLGELVSKIAAILKADACSIYLFDKSSRLLTLKATHGLNHEMIDKLQTPEGEGLVGLSLKLMQPVSVSDVSKNSDFKLIPGLGEEDMKSFLVIPLVYDQQPIGVMALQNFNPTIYKKKDIHLLMSLSLPTVNIIERTKFFGTINSVTQAGAATGQTVVEYVRDHHLKGIPAASGIAMGRIKRIKARQPLTRDQHVQHDTLLETRSLKKAFASVTAEIIDTQKKAEAKFGPDESGIFDAYLLFLKSLSFQNQIVKEIENGNSAVNALQTVVNKYMDRMSQAGDAYIKERAYDIHDIARKISDHLMFGAPQENSVFSVNEDTLFLNESWSVSDFVHLDTKHVRGILSPQGGASSHIALLADAMGIPAVFGLGDSALEIKDGDFVIVDGSIGSVIVNPSTTTINLYRQEIQSLQRQKKGYLKNTKKRVRLKRRGTFEYFPIGANIEMSGHVNHALRSGADEIGLFRTEFPFLVRSNLPTEDEQYQIYRHIVRSMKKPVTFRTLDIGGDKYISYLDIPPESNPALGWRSIRFSLDRKDLFRIQLRAILKASIYGKIKLLFPMITSLEQIREIEDTLAAVKHEIHEEGCRYASKIPVGYMIEVPAAVEIADKIAERADFLSIGTNDLTQYTLAIDRTNPKVAHLFDPFHPAVLKLIHKTVQSGHAKNIPVSVCGEAASHPLLAPLLCSMGVNSLSMNPSVIPRTKSLLSRLDLTGGEHLLNEISRLSESSEIKKRLSSFLEQQSLSEFL